MKIAAWNVNLLRVRLPQVLDWLVQNQPDVLGMQEIKIDDCALLAAAFEDIGYNLVCNGQKAYNGVAFASKLSGTRLPDRSARFQRSAAADRLRFVPDRQVAAKTGPAVRPCAGGGGVYLT